MKRKCRYCGAVIDENSKTYCCETFALKAKQGKNLSSLHNTKHRDWSQLKRLNNFAKIKGHPCIFTGYENEP